MGLSLNAAGERGLLNEELCALREVHLGLQPDHVRMANASAADGPLPRLADQVTGMLPGRCCNKTAESVLVIVESTEPQRCLRMEGFRRHRVPGKRTEK